MTRPEPRADKTLTFAPAFVKPIQHGLKTATVRYNDDKDIQAGDRLKCKTPDGTPFARVDVINVELSEVRKTPDLISRMGAKHGAKNWKDLRESLNEYYSDEIHATSDVKVIVFRRSDTDE